tara:strand:- start:681 stop:1238 length:558 start_codon:yes stop_codon:yes gene_type:complete
MPLTPNFSTSQILGVPNSIVITDTSTGSDAAIVSRRIYMQTATGEYLVETGTTTDYEEWAITTNGTLIPLTIMLDVLSKDYALNITVEWIDATTPTPIVIAFKSYVLGFTLYNETFDYQLTQVLSGNPLVINDNNFFRNKSELRTNIDGGNQAVFFATDLYAGQQCYDRATNLRLNSPYFFNANS